MYALLEGARTNCAVIGGTEGDELRGSSRSSRAEDIPTSVETDVLHDGYIKDPSTCHNWTVLVQVQKKIGASSLEGRRVLRRPCMVSRNASVQGTAPPSCFGALSTKINRAGAVLPCRLGACRERSGPEAGGMGGEVVRRSEGLL